MSTKTYVLLECMDSDAPIYQTLPDGKRSKIKKIPSHRPTLRETFQGEDGKGKTIRFKASAQSIYQDEQIINEKIDANVRFTTAEYRALEFRHGTLTTNNIGAQTYLEAHPEFEGFKGVHDTLKPKYKLLNLGEESKIKNSDTKKRVKAASVVFELDLAGAQAMLIRLNGSQFPTPKELEDCQNLLIEFIDETNDAGLDAVLLSEEKQTPEDKNIVLIGKLMAAGKLSFNADGTVTRAGVDGSPIVLASNMPEGEDKDALFSQFLNSKEGEGIKKDLVAELKAVEKAAKEANKAK